MHRRALLASPALIATPAIAQERLDLLLVLAIGCVIVRVMKGPMFVADQYPPLDREPTERQP